MQVNTFQYRIEEISKCLLLNNSDFLKKKFICKAPKDNFKFIVNEKFIFEMTTYVARIIGMIRSGQLNVLSFSRMSSIDRIAYSIRKRRFSAAVSCFS